MSFLFHICSHRCGKNQKTSIPPSECGLAGPLDGTSWKQTQGAGEYKNAHERPPRGANPCLSLATVANLDLQSPAFIDDIDLTPAKYWQEIAPLARDG